MLKIASIIGLIIVGLLTIPLPFSVTFVSAQSIGYVTIRADGNVDPTSAPIQKNGDIYTLKDDIAEYLVIERNYTTVNGDGYKIGGVFGPLLVQDGYSYTADSITNLTITNLTIDGRGIVFFSTTNTNLSHITINNGSGVDVNGDGNNLSNIVINYGRGLSVNGKYNVISNNHMTLCNYTFAENNPPPYGINVGGSDNKIIGNWIVGINGSGVNLGTSCSNVIFGNQIWENKIGITTMTIYSQNKAENNLIYYNNFVSNHESYHDEMIMIAPPSLTSWDINGIGNYWGDYTGIDLNGDGKGDTPYVIDPNNQDNYPLMKPVDLKNLPSIATPKPTLPPLASTNPVNSPNTMTPSVSPTVPEFSLLSPTFFFLFLCLTTVAIMLRRRNTTCNDRTNNP